MFSNCHSTTISSNYSSWTFRTKLTTWVPAAITTTVHTITVNSRRISLSSAYWSRNSNISMICQLCFTKIETQVRRIGQHYTAQKYCSKYRDMPPNTTRITGITTIASVRLTVSTEGWATKDSWNLCTWTAETNHPTQSCRDSRHSWTKLLIYPIWHTSLCSSAN